MTFYLLLFETFTEWLLCKMVCQYRWICCLSPQGTQNSSRIDKTIFPSFIHLPKRHCLVLWENTKGKNLSWIEKLCTDKIPSKELSEVIHYLVCGNQNAGKSDDSGSGRNILHTAWGCCSLMKHDSDEFFLNFLF